MELFSWRRVRWGLLLLLLMAGLFLMAFFVARAAFPFPYRDIIYSSAADHDLSPYLVAALIREESRFRGGAISGKGARGLMQLMPSTAEWVADQMGMDYEGMDIHDPETNVALGTWYFSHLMDRFQSVPPAVAAYNGGMARVSTWMDQGIWTGSLEDLHRIPAEETRVFVRRVVNSYSVYRWLYGGITRERE